MSAYRDKLLGFGVLTRKGTSERRPKIDERDGSVAGHETEHWDDSKDAHAVIKTARVKARLK